MPNPGIFISAPAQSTPTERAQLICNLSDLARASGFPARRGKARGSIYHLLAAIARGEIALKMRRKRAKTDSKI